ncbi:MAG: tRNA (adenosine(37)-N6)-dimethylallyltransferase MiaA [Bdellovibrionales bacterium]
MRNFIFVVGPTASGKSQLALELAERAGGVIFNCDSVQLYQKVAIGAAKPSLEDFKRVPHYLWDVVPPPQVMTAGEYRRIFLETLETIPADVPIFVVGGTGFYFLALEKGLFEIEEPSESEKKEIEDELARPGGPEKLWAELQARDPGHAQKLHIHDTYRLGRAIEILRANPGRTVADLFSQKQSSQGLEGSIFKLGLKWEAAPLEARIRERTRQMLELGLIEETGALLEENLEDWAPLKSVGYKETVQFLKGALNRSELEEQIVIATRQLAKKQRTWFQRDSSIQWWEGTDPDLVEKSWLQLSQHLKHAGPS